MDIRELLEQRRRELYGYDSDDISLENYGDISGDDDFDDEYIGDVTLESDYDTDESEYFSDDELRQIDIMASMIDDSDEYIDQAIEESSVDIMEFVGEGYINDLVFEDALFDCNSIEELEAVEESIKDTAIDFKNKAVKKVKDLWAKFTAWIKNLFSSLKNQFTSGEKLLAKYGKELASAYAARKDKVKLKSYIYKIPSGDPGKDLEVSIKDAFYGMSSKSSVVKNRDNVKKGYADAISAEGSGRKDIRKVMASKLRNDEKKEIYLKQIPLETIKYFANGQKDAIKSLKEMDKAQKTFFKDQIDAIKAVDVAKDDKAGKAEISGKVTIAKKGSSMLSMGIKAYISELKGAHRACTAIVRKLLNKATTGGEIETKLHKKVKKRL